MRPPKAYPRQYLPYLRGASRRYHIPARVLAAQDFKESSFDPNANSGVARGISQFIASTARKYGVHYGSSRGAVRSQIYGQAHYLSDLKQQRGSLRSAISGYAGGDPAYAAGVLSLSRAYRGIGRGPGDKGGVAGGKPGGGFTIPGQAPTISRTEQQSAGTALAQLTTQAMAKPTGPPSFTLPAPPVHTAQVVLPEGQATTVPQSGLVQPQQGTPLADQLAAAASDANVQDASSTVTPGTPNVQVGGGGRGRYPLARRGKIIGVPYQGTHRLGNWQSDNAVDIAVPVGTPVLSSVNGRVVKVNRAHAGDTGRFGGIAVTIKGPGRGVFYTHLSAAHVRPGERVRIGQRIGRSGSASGIAHLHYGISRGDPRQFINRGAPAAGPGGAPSGGRLIGHPQDRPGVPTSRKVLAFVQAISAQARRPITLGTGSAHSRITASGHVSDHWSGNAIDLPATGRTLIRLGRAALVRAGMPRAQARRQTGGLYNLHHGGRRIQIIFNTSGPGIGDHTTHLHVGFE